jgi:hypothetical protein
VSHRPRLIITLALVALVVTTCPAVRAVGGHMVLAVSLFLLIVHDLHQAAADLGEPSQACGIDELGALAGC